MENMEFYFGEFEGLLGLWWKRDKIIYLVVLFLRDLLIVMLFVEVVYKIW